MKVLDLFSGSGSIKKYFSNKPDVEVLSLDFEKKYKPDICVDIMEWDYKEYPVGYFDIVIAGPECKIFSQLQNTHIGKKWKDKNHLLEEQQKNSIYINKTIQIIEYLKPKYYFIENPLYSKIWDYVENKDYLKNFVIVDYCAFGFEYKKPTKFLTNKILDNVRCRCEGNPKHAYRLGIAGRNLIKNPKQGKDYTTTIQKYSYPPKLLDYLLENKNSS